MVLHGIRIAESRVRFPVSPNVKWYIVFMKDEKLSVSYFVRNLSIIVGLVLIWRGVWYTLDAFDIAFLGGSHIWTALGGIVVGLLVLYLPDHDLKEIQKL